MTVVKGIGATIYGGADFAAATNKDQYEYLLCAAFDIAAASAYVASGCKVLMYKDGMGIDNNANTTQEAMLGGVPRATAQANGWVLKNAGIEIVCADGMLLADVGNAAYRTAWINNVKAWLLANGVSGLYLDNLLAQYSNISIQPTSPPAGYTDATWEDAQVGFINAVYTSFHAAGLIVGANTYKSGANDADTFEKPYWARVQPYLDFVNSEYWVQLPDDTRLRANGSTINYNYFLESFQSLLSYIQGLGSGFSAIMYAKPLGQTVALAERRNKARFGRGNFLLDWDGAKGFFSISPQDGTDPWDTNWTFESGAPLSAKTQPQTGLWKRQFSAGIIYVNGQGIPALDRPSFSAPANTGGFLLGNTTYYYRITALNASGESMGSTETSYTTPAGTNTNKITLSWTAQYDQAFVAATGYKIYRGTASGGELLLATLGAVTTYADTSATVPAGALPTANTTATKSQDGQTINSLDALWVPGIVSTPTPGPGGGGLAAWVRRRYRGKRR